MKNKRSQGLRGTVLIMILTVMFVLIIMLMATLTIVSTAGQRIYTKYEENQAYYTARSALDIFAGNMLNDSTYKPDGTNTQGYLMQQQLYTVKCFEDDGTLDSSKNQNIYGNVDKDYLEYTVTLPKLSDGSNTYGKFDDGNNGYEPQPTTIRVEVLDRTYDPTGNRKKDTMTLKVTSTSYFEGVESTAAAILKSKKPAANVATRAVTITGSGNFLTNNSAILGGVATEATTATLANNADYWGNSYFGGSYSFDSQGPVMVATDNQWIYFGGDVTVDSGFKIRGEVSDPANRPNVFIDGDFLAHNGIATGQPGKEINIIVSNLNDPSKGNFTASSNGYTHYGDMYIMGNAKIATNGSTINGDLYVGGDLDCRGGNNRLNVTGTLYVGGSVLTDMNGDGSPRNYPDATGGVITAAAGNMPQITDDTTNNVLKVNWGSGEKSISKRELLYTQFYRYGKTDGSEGTITASEYAFLSEEELDELMKDGASSTFEYPDEYKVIHKYMNENPGIEINLGDTISSPGKYVLNPSGQFHGATTVISCGGEVELYLKDGTYNNGNIIVNAGTIVKVYGEPGGNYIFQKFKIMTDEVAGAGPLYVGEYSSLNPDGTPDLSGLMNMPISYYFEGDSTLNFYETDSIFVGHFYGPRARVNAGSAGLESINTRLYYNGQAYTPAQGDMAFLFLGSLLCNDYDISSSAKGGVAFVKASADVPPPPGLPTLTFNVSEYIRK